jgi:hypothetical protein
MTRFSSPRRFALQLTLTLVLLSLLLGSCGAMAQPPTTPQAIPPLGGTAPSDNQGQDPTRARMEHEAEKQRNLQRQEEIKRDSEKLLELATELKQYVDKTNENIISVDVIKKAEQIEKLAKSVKDKMKQ